jgi:hypothetical protein
VDWTWTIKPDGSMFIDGKPIDDPENWWGWDIHRESVWGYYTNKEVRELAEPIILGMIDKA